MNSNQTPAKQLIEVIRAALHQEQNSSFDVSEQMISLAKKHQVHNLLYAVTSAPALQKDFELLTAKSMSQQYLSEELLSYFEAHGLDILPIKGICTQGRYSDPILRTMGDVDVLCRYDQSKDIHAAMCALGYTDYKEGRKHDHYSMPPYMTVEVHRELVDGDNEFYDYYQNFWKRCQPKRGCKYIYQMSLEDEYIFNLVHLTNHFTSGGIGIRFIVDVYVYEHTAALNRSYIETELAKIQLLDFYRHLQTLSLCWFGTDEERSRLQVTPTLEALSNYILASGIYGTLEHYANFNAEKGKLKTFLHACFPGYNSMKSMFPWLIPPLLPLAWTLRAARAAIYRRNNIKTVWNSSMTGDAEKGKAIKQFYVDCGLTYKC